MQRRKVREISLDYKRINRICVLEGAGIYFSDPGALTHVQKQHVSGARMLAERLQGSAESSGDTQLVCVCVCDRK